MACFLKFVRKRVVLLGVLCCLLAGSAQGQDSFHAYQGVFFRISGNGLKCPSYILGTLHTIPGDFVYTLPGFEEIIGSVEQMVTEYDFDSQWKDLPHENASEHELDSLYSHITTLYTRKDGSVRPFVDDLSRKQRDQVLGSLEYWGFSDPESRTFVNVYKNFKEGYLKRQLEEIDSKGYDFKMWESSLDWYLMDSIAAKYHLPLIGLDKQNAVNRYTDEKERLEMFWGPETKRKTYSQYLGNKIISIREGLQAGTFHFSQLYLEGNVSWIQFSGKSPGDRADASYES